MAFCGVQIFRLPCHRAVYQIVVFAGFADLVVNQYFNGNLNILKNSMPYHFT